MLLHTQFNAWWFFYWIRFLEITHGALKFSGAIWNALYDHQLSFQLLQWTLILAIEMDREIIFINLIYVNVL